MVLNTPPRVFTLLSFVFIALMVVGTGYALSTYFRQAIIDREGIIIRDLAQNVAVRELLASDLWHHTDPSAQEHLERSFRGLAGLSEVVRVKVFNREHLLVWSDEPALVGTHAVRGRNVTRALQGQTTVVFYPYGGRPQLHDDLPGIPLVEFYVPIAVHTPDIGDPVPVGALALYRSADTLNATMQEGVLLVWAVTAAGGLALYLALFALFRSVYRRQREAEGQLSRLGSEHARILQMEKLSAVGQMIGEIAHQINNPLVGVMNLAQLAEREADDPVRTRELLADIRSAGEHCRDFVQRMLTFTKISRFERQDVELQALIGETARLLRESAGHHPEVVLDLPDEPVHLQVDPVLIRHALFNLLANAVQVNPAGAAIRVRLVRMDRPDAREPGWAIRVLDEGPGISAELAQQMFTPFYTTRAGGVGLGLSVCEQIAVQHGGAVFAANRPDRGACFTLWLPETQPAKTQ